MKHTVGPWHVVSLPGSDIKDAIADQWDGLIATTNARWPTTAAEANARLIAMTPRLVNLLEAYVNGEPSKEIQDFAVMCLAEIKELC